MLNFDDVEREIKQLRDIGQYKDIVKRLKHIKYEWPDEYAMWLLGTKTGWEFRLINLINSLELLKTII
jgi:hypothetical protein